MTDHSSFFPGALSRMAQATDAERERDRFWVRIAQDLAQAIGRGVYQPGERLPSEHVLAQQFGVNRHTNVIVMLQNNGFTIWV